MKVVISGISSALSKYAAKRLVKMGYSVLGFSRDVSNLDIPGVELRSCDICDKKSVLQLTSSADVIVHAAAFSAPWGKAKQFYDVNVAGTQNIVDGALQGGCSRFIHISTPSIYIDYRDRLEIVESQQAKSPANCYVKTKLLAEQIVDWAGEQGLSTITLRPRALFGPGDRVLLPRILRALKQGGVPRFRNKEVLIDVTYIENCADAIVNAVMAPSSCSGEKYNITNGEPIELHALFKLLLEELGLEYREKKVPYQCAKFLASLLSKLAHVVGKEPLFTPYTIGVLAHSQTLSIEKAQKELKYNPRISLTEGVRRYAQWWQNTQNI